MDMKYSIFIFFLFISFAVQAQTGNYSYIEDRKFYEIETLYGYDFKPFKVEYMDGSGGRIKAGNHSFAYFNNKLYVIQGDKKSVFWVNNAEPTKYGYILKTMNARDATMQGQLKVILNEYGEAETLIFRKTKQEEEIIYYLPSLSEEPDRKKKEKKYFTDLNELQVEDQDSLWGKNIYPFIKVQENQYRFQIEDSTRFELVEKYRVVDKRKQPKAEEGKSKKKKKGKKKKGEEVVEEVIEEEVEEMVQDTVPTLESLDGKTKEELEEIAANDPKVKLILEHYFIVKTFQEQADGTRKERVSQYRIKGIQELEDESAPKGTERFQLDFTIDGGNHIFMYLMDDRTVSYLELENSTYFVRGH